MGRCDRLCGVHGGGESWSGFQPGDAEPRAGVLQEEGRDRDGEVVWRVEHCQCVKVRYFGFIRRVLFCPENTANAACGFVQQ